MTLRRRLLLAFVGMAVVPISVLAAVATWGAIRLTEQRGREALAGRLDDLARLIDRELLAERSFLAALIAERMEAHTTAPGLTLEQWLAARLQVHGRRGQLTPFTARLLLLETGSTDAFVIAGHLGERQEVTMRGGRQPIGTIPPAYVRALAESGRRDQETIWLPTGPVVALFVPVPESDARPGALLVEELSAVLLLEDLVARSAGRHLDSSFAAAGVEPSGRRSFLYHSDPTLIGLPLSEDGRDAPEVAAPSSWICTRSGDSLRAAGLHASTGWLLGGATSLFPDVAPLQQAIRAFLLLFGLTAALVVAGILLVTRGIGRAVEEIAASTEAIARGDLTRTPRLSRSDEFGAIAAHVDQMAQDLVLTAESRSIARLSARLVHELKGVASQMKLMLFNLREHYDDPEFRAEALDLMQDLAGQVEALALRLRHGGEESPPTLESIDLDRVLARLLDERIAPAWPSLVIERELGARGEVVASEELVREALENVVTNAVEAMEGRGTLRVTSGRIERTGAAEPGGPTHFVEVEDSGPGMSRDFIERHLFRPFTTTKPEGIGLGMYQVRQALARLGGRVEVWSREGSGTRVRIELGRRPQATGVGEYPRSASE